MIVICTKCQAKFRVPDDKIGPRGAKVRCSRCQTVFVVHRDASDVAAVAAPRAPAAVELEAFPPPAPASPENPFATRPVRASASTPADAGAARLRPPPLPGSAQARPAVDPFSLSALADPLRAAPAPSPDPFAAPAADPFAPAAGDPFSAPAPSDPFAVPASSDPFAAPAPPDPFAAPADPFASPGPGPGLPVTDLSALLGAAAGASPDARADLDPAPPAATEVGAPESTETSGTGLSLEERHTPPPAPVGPAGAAPRTAFAADPGAVLETAAPDDSFDGGLGGDGAGFDPGAFDLGGAAVAVAPALAREPSALQGVPALAEPGAPPARAAAAEPGREAAPARAPALGPVAERLPRAPGARIRAVLLNAVALAALLLVALVLLAVWRTDGPIDAGALRPAALVAALSRGGGSGPFAARELRAGLYERERGPPVLFVRGKVVSRAGAPVRAVAVTVEVVRGGEVVARGEALAGGVPTAEELWGAPDAVALAAVAAAAARRAPAEVRPGETVPFLVAIADHPADLDGASLRVAAAPAGSGAP